MRVAVRAVLAVLGLLALLVVGGPEVLPLDGRSLEPVLLDGLGAELLVGVTGIVALVLPRLLLAARSLPVRRPASLGPATAAPPRAATSVVRVCGGERAPPRGRLSGS